MPSKFGLLDADEIWISNVDLGGNFSAWEFISWDMSLDLNLKSRWDSNSNVNVFGFNTQC